MLPPDTIWDGVSKLGLHLLSREWYPAPLGSILLLPAWGAALGVTQKGVDLAVLGAAGDIVGQPEWIYQGVACAVVSLPPVSGESELVEEVLSLAPREPQAEEEPIYFVATHKFAPRITFVACAPGASSSSGLRGVRVLCSAGLGGAEELSVAAVWVSLEGNKTISEGPIAAHRRAMAVILAKRTVDYRPPVEGIDIVAPERLGDPQPWKLGQPAPHQATATQMGKAGPSTRPDFGTTSLREFAGPGLVANTDGHASVSDTALSGVQKVVGHAPAATKLRVPSLAKRLNDLS